MDLQKLEELMTTRIQASRTGQCFWPLLKTNNIYNLTIFANTMLPYLYYNIDPSWNRMDYGTIYESEWLKKSILLNFNENSSGTWKIDLKPCLKIVNNKMSMVQLAKKLKIILFSYWKKFMQITLSSFLPYPSNIMRRPHLTLLTSCILVAIFPPMEALTFCIKI